MKVGVVCGTVVCTVQHPFYEGRKQLIVRFIEPGGAYIADDYVVAIDQVGAGVGQRVLVKDEGNSARQLTDSPAHAPVRSVVIGIVDSVDVG